MGDKHRLHLRLRYRGNGQFFEPVEVYADPEDHDELQRQLVELARDQDGRRNHGWAWQHEYELFVLEPDRPWVPLRRIPGKDID